MAAQKKDINLLPREGWEKRPIGRIVWWALTIGRYIVVITELVVIVVFISRFKFDRDLSNLYEQIGAKQTKIKSLEDFEKKFRLVQKRLRAIKELGKKQPEAPKALTDLASLIPSGVTLRSFQFDTKQISVSGRSLSELNLLGFLNNLLNSPHFVDIKVEEITKGKGIEINFRLKAKLNF
jgi:Tfp pilus assembly protein PilN